MQMNDVGDVLMQMTLIIEIDVDDVCDVDEVDVDDVGDVKKVGDVFQVG